MRNNKSASCPRSSARGSYSPGGRGKAGRLTFNSGALATKKAHLLPAVPPIPKEEEEAALEAVN